MIEKKDDRTESELKAQLADLRIRRRIFITDPSIREDIGQAIMNTHDALQYFDHYGIHHPGAVALVYTNWVLLEHTSAVIVAMPTGDWRRAIARMAG